MEMHAHLCWVKLQLQLQQVVVQATQKPKEMETKMGHQDKGITSAYVCGIKWDGLFVTPSRSQVKSN